MADNVDIKDATGTTKTVGSDDISGTQVQRMKLGWGADGSYQDASTAAPMPIQGPAVVETTGTITASGQSVITAMPADDLGVVLEFSGTFTSTTTIQFEVSYDGGGSYRAVLLNPAPSINPTAATSTTGNVYAFGATHWSGDVAGATHFRARCSSFVGGDSVGIRIRTIRENTRQVQNYQVTGAGGVGSAPVGNPVYNGGTDGSNTRAVMLSTKGNQPGSTPYYMAVQAANDSGRTALIYYATAAAAGTTTTETAITLTKSSGTSATTTAASFVVTNGKRFRIVQLMVATRGNAIATIQSTTFNLRINTGGAVTTTSTPIVLSARSATPATASAWDRAMFDLGGDGYEILGDGTLQFGITAAATYTTNAPTWDVTLIGYEY